MGRPEHIEARIGPRRLDRRIGRQAIARLATLRPDTCRVHRPVVAPSGGAEEFQNAAELGSAVGVPRQLHLAQPHAQDGERQAPVFLDFPGQFIVVVLGPGEPDLPGPSAWRTNSAAWTKPERWSQCSCVAIRRSISPSVTLTMLSITCWS